MELPNLERLCTEEEMFELRSTLSDVVLELLEKLAA